MIAVVVDVGWAVAHISVVHTFQGLQSKNAANTGTVEYSR